jgi:hypothetical protein
MEIKFACNAAYRICRGAALVTHDFLKYPYDEWTT